MGTTYSTKDDIVFRYGTLFTFVALTLIGCLFHEFWRDEAGLPDPFIKLKDFPSGVHYGESISLYLWRKKEAKPPSTSSRRSS